MKESLYIDTSIPSAFFDLSKPMRQLITQRWFEDKSQNFVLYISTLTMTEVEDTINEIRRNTGCKLLKITDEAIHLSNLYIEHGAIPPGEPEDALHIAIATVNNIFLLASWNFKHIVSVNPIRKVNEINIKNNYPYIQIGSLEIYGGSEYGNL